MKKNHSKRSVVIMSMVAILGLGAYAYADWGMGNGHEGLHHGVNNQGISGRHHMEGYASEHMDQENLSADQIEKLDHEYDVFLTETEGIRQELYKNEIELRDEMSKENPDSNKVLAVQKEISTLKGQIDSKAIEFRLKARKINPDSRAEYFDGNHMMGGGRNHMAGNGHMMGNGSESRRYGNCW